ncbi:uncharacterized protein LOC129971059 [Argiope bruennichi]|uniref:uncharacterized protein LOC129971059 n=1 Tax=Argiope bruennichi TaxID=94029 RepID=UPI002494BBC2|nr:uncharacterized protein LOC129971059 [Argiope bruennichi]XP_055940505.1 uncharacterized protein LOC129971059 [Argiope bruennichi]
MYLPIKRNVFNTTLEIRIKDFCTATEMVSIEHEITYEDFHFFISASVFPNGTDKETEGWLVVLPNIIFNRKCSMFSNTRLFQDDCFLSGTVSIIDVQGDSRLPRYFEKPPSKVPSTGTKYLKKSLILNRADELLNEGILTLLCDIESEWNGITVFCANIVDGGMEQQSLTDFLFWIPQALHRKNDIDTEGHGDTFRVYNLTSQIFTSSMPHDLNMYFDTDGISPVVKFLNSVRHSNEDNTDVKECIWIFDTYPDKFCLSLSEHQENVGARLLKSCPVIRLCVNTPMKEQHEKCIDFSHVDSQTFKIVLYYLEKGSFPNSSFQNILNVYKFSHMYLMERLQKKCAEFMAKRLGNFQKSRKLFSHMYLKLKNIADAYSDDYLSSSILEYENSASRQ